MARFATLVTLAVLCALATFATASAQTPTDAQKQALRSNCPSDFRKNCAGVPTGGMAALVCLEQHVDTLSPACQSAVKAVQGDSGSSSTKAAASTTTEAPASTSAPAASKDTAAKPAGTTAAAPAAAAPPPGGPMPFFQEVRIAARACAMDFHKFCPTVPLGHGNAIFCLRVHGPQLDPTCRKALQAAGTVLD